VNHPSIPARLAMLALLTLASYFLVGLLLAGLWWVVA
jgi:hypothetical protein